MSRLSSLMLVVVILCQPTDLFAADVSPKPVTFQDLLSEMTDLNRLAEMPSPSFQTNQNSSYDRSSRSPADAKTWFANKDWAQYIRTEEHDGRRENVILDAKGPGAVVRLWSANPKGVLRVYLDDNDSPIIESPMKDVMAGRESLAIPEPIAGVQSEGYNLFLPIPFAKSCKITSDGASFYYAVNYRVYQSTVAVQSFQLDDLKVHAPLLQTVAKRLTSPQELAPAKLDSTVTNLNLAAGAKQVLPRILGPKAIRRLFLKCDPKISEQALRGTILRVRFDDAQTIEVPLGDFFGAGPGVNPFSGLPLGVTEKGEMYCHWVMPFKTSAEFELENLGEESLACSLEIGISDYDFTDKSLYFHAGYRAQANIPTTPKIDWNYLTVNGRGRLVGTSLTIDNPLPAWWGEGDEKIYIDGESFPSWFGTGTEDYFGYAWSSSDRFSHAYHNQSRCDGPVNYGRTSVNRFHIMDSIPFQKSLCFDMELWHSRYCHINQAVTMYWYASGGATDGYAPLEAEDLKIHPMPEYKVPKVANAIEAETMKVLYHDAKVDSRTWFGASGDSHIWWYDMPKPGDRLELSFSVAKAGQYKLLSRFILAPNNGIVRFKVNHKTVNEAMDFYQADFALSKEMEIGTCELKAGENTLTVEMVGTNPAGEHLYMFCMDYLRPLLINEPSGK